MPYAPPKNAAILFDDSILPAEPDYQAIQEFFTKFAVQSVFFDFERPKSEELCRFLRTVPLSEMIVPPHYAGICDSYVLAPPYRLNIPYTQYLQTLRQKYRRTVIDLAPVCCSLRNGVWRQDLACRHTGGQFSEKHRCMYLTQSTELHFYDTRASLLSRAAASGCPCLLPLAEFENL